jgi:hypothetical protein
MSLAKIRKLIAAVGGIAVILGVDNVVVDAVVGALTSVLVYVLPNASE